MTVSNIDIRKAIEKKKLRHYQVARACGVTCYTFSHWLQTELPDKKKQEILKTIKGMK